jgi:hypothetical protein
VKDLTTYALSYAAVLTAAIAVMGLLASTIDPARLRASEPEAMVVQADTAHAAATMNIPF